MYKGTCSKISHKSRRVIKCNNTGWIDSVRGNCTAEINGQGWEVEYHFNHTPLCHLIDSFKSIEKKRCQQVCSKSIGCKYADFRPFRSQSGIKKHLQKGTCRVFSGTCARIHSSREKKNGKKQNLRSTVTCEGSTWADTPTVATTGALDGASTDASTGTPEPLTCANGGENVLPIVHKDSNVSIGCLVNASFYNQSSCGPIESRKRNQEDAETSCNHIPGAHLCSTDQIRAALDPADTPLNIAHREGHNHTEDVNLKKGCLLSTTTGYNTEDMMHVYGNKTCLKYNVSEWNQMTSNCDNVYAYYLCCLE